MFTDSRMRWAMFHPWIIPGDASETQSPHVDVALHRSSCRYRHHCFDFRLVKPFFWPLLLVQYLTSGVCPKMWGTLLLSDFKSQKKQLSLLPQLLISTSNLYLTAFCFMLLAVIFLFYFSIDVIFKYCSWCGFPTKPAMVLCHWNICTVVVHSV